MTSKQYKMPVLDMLPIAYFVNGDSGQKKTTKQAWDKKFIIAEEIAVIVPIPESVLDDSDYDIWGEVKPRVTEAFGTKIDGAALFGVDKPSTWRDDIVTTATKAGSVVTLGSADPLYDKIMAEEGVLDKVEKCGYLVNGHMADVSMRAKLRGLKNANGDPLFKSDMQGSTQYALDGSPMNFPINGAWDKSKALMVSGDFFAACIFYQTGYYIQAVYRRCCTEYRRNYRIQPDAERYGCTSCSYAYGLGSSKSYQCTCKKRRQRDARSRF